MDLAYVIPARMKSTRFPGKPLHLIQGKEMILHVLDRVASISSIENIFVATDSSEISKTVCNYGFQVVETDAHMTGTDRIAEANRKINADYILNIQGDEPVFNPQDIVRARDFLLTSNFEVITGFCTLNDSEDWQDKNTIKLVSSRSGRLLYISRSPIPGSKMNYSDFQPTRQVCIYGYTRRALENFSLMARSDLELEEDHELLRFLENDISVGVVKLSDWSIPVDLPSDVELVEKQLTRKFGII